MCPLLPYLLVVWHMFIKLFSNNEEIDVDSVRHELTEGEHPLTVRGQHSSMQRQCHKSLGNGIAWELGHFAEVFRINHGRSPDFQEPVDAWICIVGPEGSITEWWYDSDWSYDSSTAMDAKPAIPRKCIAEYGAAHAQNIIEEDTLATFSYNQNLKILRKTFLSTRRTCRMIFNFMGESQASMIKHLQYSHVSDDVFNINLQLTDEWEIFCGISIPTYRNNITVQIPRVHISNISVLKRCYFPHPLSPSP